MKFKIHRGTTEIGGSCVEVWTDSSRVVLDLGMPLVDDDKTSPFDSEIVRNSNCEDLIKRGVLPNVDGLYNDDGNTALILSHAHQDHYGLVQYIHDSCPVFMGEPTHNLIEITNIFTPNECHISNPHYFTSGKSFHHGDIEITPFLMDHAAFDAHAFLVKANGKSLFYSGDFRVHGRKKRAFDWFSYNVDQNVDYLLLEGTTIGRGDHSFPTEAELEQQFVEQFKNSKGINLVYASGQNIDRLVSLYRACKRSGKTLAIDFYIATVLKELAMYAKLPYPSKNFPEIKVFFPKFLSRKIANQGDEKLLYQFKSYKITKDQINDGYKNIVMLTRPSMKFDITSLNCLDGGSFIYSMWSGYRKEHKTKEFIDYLVEKGMSDISIHTSGHADRDGLKRMVEALKPKNLVPIHTFEGDEYRTIFDGVTVKRINDGEVVTIGN